MERYPKDAEAILGSVVLILCGFGCGAMFSCISSWAKGRKDPMPFWSGSVIAPETITDIPAYNKAIARMWRRYAVPYWMTGAFGFVGFLNYNLAAMVGCLLIGLASTIGIVWLILAYKRIEKQYKVENP